MSKLSSDIQQQIERGISILKQGGLIAFPTDTVYGLGAGLNFPIAIERIYAVKNRPRNLALPLLLADESQVSQFAEAVPAVARLLMRHFWPGALTLVLCRSSAVPDIITAGGTTVALRVPAHPVPVALVKGLEMPVVGTSANISGQSSPLTAPEVHSQLGDKIDFVIDGGRCAGGKESTVVDVTGETPVILREGALSVAQIERVCGKIKSREGE
ncbi:MAG: threonylcarbamoyl-AMP synthase [Chloroflexi bacterium]|nr:threonylcarbamoyl-AMP synthase [Chloroflexota bacterium]